MASEPPAALAPRVSLAPRARRAVSSYALARFRPRASQPASQRASDVNSLPCAGAPDSGGCGGARDRLFLMAGPRRAAPSEGEVCARPQAASLRARSARSSRRRTADTGKAKLPRFCWPPLPVSSAGPRASCRQASGLASERLELRCSLGLRDTSAGAASHAP